VTLDDAGKYMLGTLAGNITVTLNSITTGSCPTGSGTNLIEGKQVSQTQTVPAAGPVISSVVATGTPTTGITITVIGFSNTKDLVLAAFTFTAPAGTQVNGSAQNVSLSQPAAAYFSTAAAGTFEYVQTFPYSGDAKAFPTGITVVLSNSFGVSNLGSATIAP
jgi:hypothetical protein